MTRLRELVISLWNSLFKVHAVVPLIVFAGFIVITGFAIFAFRQFEVSDCNERHLCSANPDSPWQPTGAFVAVAGAFFLGGLLGKLPHPRPGAEVAGRAAQFGLTVLSLAIAAAWAYETKAVADPDWKPITQYVMIIKAQQPDWTLLVFVVAALIAGRWLWHRPGTYLT
jgi:hypothetical protein